MEFVKVHGTGNDFVLLPDLEGLIDLDAPANEYLRAYRLVAAKAEFPPATVRHLLTHTAGIPEVVSIRDLLHPDWGSFMSRPATHSVTLGEPLWPKGEDHTDEYFGTQEGLLVVRTPEDEALGLKAGDVILTIDGRKPSSPAQAMRILRSYDEGDAVKIEVMRKQKRVTVNWTVPDREDRIRRARRRSPEGERT